MMILSRPIIPFRFLFVVLMLHCFSGYGQTVTGFVKDQAGFAVKGATVRDSLSNTTTISDEKGFFYLSVTTPAILVIEHPYYQPFYLDVIANLSDTTNHEIQLFRKTKTFAEVQVDAEYIKKIGEQRNENFIDYLPYEDYLIALKRKDRQKWMTYESNGKTLIEFNLGKRKVNRLTEDCYGNIQLVGDDWCYQMGLDEAGVRIIDSIPKKVFDYMLKPCMGDFDNHSVFANYTKHNRFYTLTSINKETGEKKFFYHAGDYMGSRVAQECYAEILSEYFNSIPFEESSDNIVLNGLWDGDLRTLPNVNPNRVIWYYHIRAVELDIATRSVGEQVHTFDCYNDSLFVFEPSGRQLNGTDFPLGRTENDVSISVDESTNQVYALVLKKGVYDIYAVNSYTGKSNLVKSLKEVRFPENLKIRNNYLYFIDKETGGSYGHLFRVRL